MAQTESVKKSSNANKGSSTSSKNGASTSNVKTARKYANKSASAKKSYSEEDLVTPKKSLGTSRSTESATKKSISSKSGSKASSSNTNNIRSNSSKGSIKTNSNKTSNGTKKNITSKNSNKKVSAKSSKQTVKHSIWEEYDFPVVREVVRWMLVAFSIILCISSFSQEGDNLVWLKKINFGIFGWGGYVSVLFTIYLAFFVIPEMGRAKAWIRLVSMLLVISSVCCMMQIFCEEPLSSETTFAMYYAMGYEQGGGGIFGGIMAILLYPWFGTVGMGIILVAIIISGIVVMSERSGMAFLKKITAFIYTNMKQDMEEYREKNEMVEQERQRKREIREKKEAKARVRTEERNQLKKKKKMEHKKQEFDEENEAEWRRLEEEAALYISEQYDEQICYEDDSKYQPYELEENELENSCYHDDEIANREANEEQQQDSYVKSEVEKIRKRMARKQELKEEANKPLVEWNDTTEDTLYNNPVDYGDVRDKYSNTSGEDDVRLAVAGTRTVVTASGKVITVESDEIPPAVKKRTIPVKTQQQAKINREEVNEGSNVLETVPSNNKNNEENIALTKEKQKEMEEKVAEGESMYIPPKPYCFPPLDLLKVGDRKSSAKNQEKELRETAEVLEQTFRDFGVGVSVTNYSCGPTVTRYELEPDHGVKVSRITALTDDIKLKLAATDLRMEAPIPGKAAVGIEVPNKENSTVMFRDLVESETFQKHPSKIAFAVGKDIAGKVIVFDIARMPHVLIAGATGSGKSVCINTLIMSILYKAEPSEVKLIMVDPKVVELSVYNGIPHLLNPVVTDPKKAAGALNWAVAEMTRRYQMFAETVTRDLAGYNKKAKEIRAELAKEGLTPDKIEQEGPEILPQIVIIVDELADLMMVAPNEVEEAICRLAQLARAAGIHLVLATQRPSVNVITGLIKANVPSRIAFSVSSGVDSRTILDMNGAEKLLGKGDMLFAPFGYNKPVRVQGAFVSDAEVMAITEFIKQENGQAHIQDKTMKVDFALDNESTKEVDSNRDEYFEKAAYFLIEKEKGSIGMLQRMFKIGFNRAARIMDQLVEAGVVGPEEGTKPRKIIMTKEEFQEFMENN